MARPLGKVGFEIMKSVDPSFWRNRRVFLTGHTGFKGSWLSLWLQSLGADVHGLALPPPTDPSLFDAARVADGMNSRFGDVRDLTTVQGAMADCSPEIVIHLAAQPLVRYSYEHPVETYATNVMGTVHVLETALQVPGVRAVVNVTSDKCYENREWVWAYRENEPMGGHDPYSNSKGCSELITSAYRSSFFSARAIGLASARAGNVIGGGDWARDRLVPDVLRAFECAKCATIRNPHALRPWQHVLEPLSGYLVLAQSLYQDTSRFAEGWNFGPLEADAKSVNSIVKKMAELWGGGATWAVTGGDHPHEASFLKLDISKARACLDWHPRWSLEVTLKKTIVWHRGWRDGHDPRLLCMRQISEFSALL